MTPLHQQLLDTLREAEILRESLTHADELSLRLEEEKKEFIKLDKALSKENEDVYALEDGITSLFWKFIGTREEKIEKEREDYERVSQRHIELFKSIELIKLELEILKKKEDTLKSVEEKLANLLREREKELVLSDVIIAGLLNKLNDDTLEHNVYLKKVEKINTFGRSILGEIINIENLLDEARTHNLSLLEGSTPLAYDTIENARRLVQKTNRELVRFKKDLTTLLDNIHLDTRINIEHFGTYADRSILTHPDAPTFLQKIKISRRSVRDNRDQLEFVLTCLDDKQGKVLDRIAGVEEERKRVILSAK